MSHLIKIYAVGKFSYFRLWYLELISLNMKIRDFRNHKLLYNEYDLDGLFWPTVLILFNTLEALCFLVCF